MIDRSVADGDLRSHERRGARRHIGRGQISTRRILIVRRLYEPEVEHFHVVHRHAHPARDQVRRLDVAVHEPAIVRFSERQANLLEEMDGAGCAQRTEAADEFTQVQSVQQFHDVVKRAIFRSAEVVQFDRVGRPEIRGGPGLAPEPLDDHPGAVRPFGPQCLWPDQLDRRGSCEKPVRRLIDVAHAAMSDPLSHPVAAELTLA